MGSRQILKLFHLKEIKKDKTNLVWDYWKVYGSIATQLTANATRRLNASLTLLTWRIVVNQC